MLEVSQVKLPLDTFASPKDPSGGKDANEAEKNSSEGKNAFKAKKDILSGGGYVLKKEEATEAAAQALGIPLNDIASVRLLKRSVDARKKTNVHFVATLGVELVDPSQEKSITALGNPSLVREHKAYEPLVIKQASSQLSRQRPIVVGSGPAGLFAALYLARAGHRPYLIEQGKPVDERTVSVGHFIQGGNLDPFCNIQFGEGGAGTFSDGKLTTNIKSPYTKHVLQWFFEAGAPEEILWLAKPHLGTDRLSRIVQTMRDQIIQAGGEVRFSTRLVDIEFNEGKVCEASLNDVSTGASTSLPATQVILASGHSSRSTYDLLARSNIFLEQKPFSLGVRIEHVQKVINQAQYGAFASHASLGAADYKLVQHLSNGRSVYTFCMCPGGEVICAASEEGGVVVNGMSRFVREGENANSALLVNVTPSDFNSSDPLAGIKLQRQIENSAFNLALAQGGITYQAPAQTVGDFLAHKGGEPSKEVQPSYAQGVVWCDLRASLPDFVSESLERALPLLGRKLDGFDAAEAVLTGVETRSSSPVRVCRSKQFQAFVGSSKDESGLYPCGEGSGYAGGIMSSAVDGLRVAEALCKNLGI